MGTAHHLDDKYTATSGSAFMNGTQALVRLPMVQVQRDKFQGLDTGAFITGYRGSPIGAYDQQLQRAAQFLQPSGVVFQPGVNEELAATAIWGSQQVPLSSQANKDGVVGIWYGKGPGVDRCGDVFKHGNAAGSSAHGGVLCIAGDDHAAKSSTVPHQSDHAFMAAVMPVLFPSSVHEFIELGLLGIAMSRYSGCWVGYKVISDTIETSAVVSLERENFDIVTPSDFVLPEDGLNIRWPDPPLIQDERLQEQKAYAALAFAHANKIDQLVVDSPQARFGIVATGKAYEDARQALRELGIDEQSMREIGIRIYKVRMPWPLEPKGIRQFSEGLEEVLIVEERREIIEHQIKQQLFNWRADVRPRIIGKFDDNDEPFLPLSTALSISRVARAIAERLLKLSIDESLKRRIEERLAYLQKRADERARHQAPIDRQPWFCSGCPHNTSTKVPEGSKAMAGIGCHYMSIWMDRSTETFTQMGGEGVPWSSISHFTDEKHRFVNLGDGTYFHSGYLAVRASVAAKVNITYKVLYNDAVEMTGGQDIDGELTPGKVTRQLQAEGVWPIYLLTDEPEKIDKESLASGIIIKHRDELDPVMRKLRELEGCNAIVYVQTCAAEKRRRRKRGLLEDPAKRVFINTDVCEGCGDCSVQSNCVSVEPVDTEFGRKRRINQSSCNKDYSCLKGFCPSFVTVYGGEPAKSGKVTGDVADKVASNVASNNDSSTQPTTFDLPEPDIQPLGDEAWNIVITGVGGTGVLTIGALLGMAAHIDGKAPIVLDMAGLAQKGGAVLSQVRIANEESMVSSPNIVAGGADVLIAADAVVAASSNGVVLCEAERTHAVVNTTTAPVAAFIGNRDLKFRYSETEATIGRVVKSTQHFQTFGSAATKLVGDSIATNIMMLGYTWQLGLVPLSFAALDEAMVLNGVAVEANRLAFAWGRQLAADPAVVKAALKESETANAVPIVWQKEMSLDELIEHRRKHLVAYQGNAWAKRYGKSISALRESMAAQGLGDKQTRIAATQLAKLMSYKDEYEVARLYSRPEFKQSLVQNFSGEYSLKFNMAPPILGGTAPDDRPLKREFGPWVLSLFKVLQKGRKLRGTVLDPFGRSAERKAERAWIKRYEEDLIKLVTVLESRTPDASTAAEYSDAVTAILQVPDNIRGFGPVKHEAMEKALIAREEAWSHIDALAHGKVDKAA